MIVYWIKEKTHTDIYKEGYVGITKGTLHERVRAHRKNKNNSIVARKIRSNENLDYTVVHDVDTLAEALKLEALYRPTQNTGWNLQRGGEIGVESSWYDVPENRLKHSMKTSEATRRGIATKDTKEARSERARQNHLKSTKYKDSVRGDKNPRALLTESSVKKIKYEMIPSGLTNMQISSIFGVKPYVISFIRTGKNWSYV